MFNRECLSTHGEGESHPHMGNAANNICLQEGNTHMPESPLFSPRLARICENFVYSRGETPLSSDD
jgi:hypothetical protein